MKILSENNCTKELIGKPGVSRAKKNIHGEVR